MNWVIMLIIALVVSYLIGSINFALIVSKIFVKKDVRKMGSGNAGMTNVIRTVGIVPGIITFVGDFGKGLATPLIAKFLLFPYIAENAPDFIANFLTPEYGVYFCGFLCIIGHAYPIFFGFRGGKGVSTSIAVLFCINWIVAAFVLTTFLVLFLITKIISIGSVLGAVEFPIFNFLINYNKGLDTIELVYIVVLSVLIASLVFLKHKDNIIRLNKGEEKQLSSHK
ncbi:MAG: glycerol-3-phosphate 1-O-acyltransferase PlsY [Clostridia bacterium]|nr:glycerol-3-phosphate 1-O-acyltransferase PlsY [Clostridia bacterium]